MAPASYVGAGDLVTNSGTGPVTSDAPDAAFAVGDIKHLHVFSFNNGTIPTPSGWTLLRQLSHPSATGASALFRRVHESGDTLPAISGPGGGTYGVLSAWRGADVTQPEDVAVPAATSGNSNSLTAPSVDTASADAVVVWYFAQSDNNILDTPTNSAIDRYSGSLYSTIVGGDCCMASASKTITSPGASGTCSLSSSGTASWITMSVAIRPIGGAPPAIVASHFFLAAC